VKLYKYIITHPGFGTKSHKYMTLNYIYMISFINNYRILVLEDDGELCTRYIKYFKEV
jgi:hypothetical protein